MPAPHDLDPPSMTEKERLAKKRQDAAIAWELHALKTYGVLEWLRLLTVLHPPRPEDRVETNLRP